MGIFDNIFRSQPKSDSLSDKYAAIVDSTSFNPFKITTNPSLNQNLRFGDLTEVFKKEIEQTIQNTEGLGLLDKSFFYNTVLKGYTFNLLESYFNKAGYIPKLIMDMILKQIYNAAKQTSKAHYLNDISFDDYCYDMYYTLTHN